MCALKPSAPNTLFSRQTIIATLALPPHCALPTKSFYPRRIPTHDSNLRSRRPGFNVFIPLSSLRETQKQTSLSKVGSVPPKTETDKLHVGGAAASDEASDSDSDSAAVGAHDAQKVDEDENDGIATVGESADGEEGGGIGGDTALKGTILAALLLVGVVGGFGGVGYVYKDQINAFLIQFSDVLEGYGPAAYALFVAVYAGLEILAIPAIPLTMSAGLLFGNVTGTIIVSISGTIAATVAFLVARYFARERIMKLVEGNKKFVAIDKAIGENGFRVVTLLRLSPLLPFSLGNYLYGLTSVKLVPYVLGSWLGMLPGTWAYVSAGAFGRAFIQEEAEGGFRGGNEQLLTLGLGLLVTAIAATYVTRLAKDAVKDIE